MRGRASTAAAVQTGSTTVFKTLFFLHHTLSPFGHRLVERGETSLNSVECQSCSFFYCVLTALASLVVFDANLDYFIL